MRSRTLAILILGGALALAVVAGCGVTVSSESTPAPPPAAAASPAASPSATPASPSASPSPSPSPSGTPEAVAAALRRAEAATRVKAALPRFDTLAAAMVARSGVPGAAVAVVAGDGAVYVRCYGVREAGRPEAVDKDTVFPLGSLSEGFTSTMLASLVSAREIGWDDPVSTSWPGFRLTDPWVSRHATFRDLLARRSGLPAFAGDELVAFGYGRGEILRRLHALRPAAGFRAAYAPQSALPTAAATAAERATGRAWAHLVRARVLHPLAMRATTLSPAEYRSTEDRVAPHRLEGVTMTPQLDVPAAEEAQDVFAPALGVSSSVADMVTFVRMQLNDGAVGGERIAAPDDLAATHTAATVVAQDARCLDGYGLGWGVGGADGRLVVQQSGDLAAGSSALVSMLPADGVGVIVLTNAFPEGHALGRALATTLYELAAGSAGVAGTSAAAASAGPVVPAPSVSPSPATSPSSPALPTPAATPADALAVEQQLLLQAPPAVEALPAAHLGAQPPVGAAPPRARRVYEGVYANEYYGRITVRRGAGAGLRVKLGRGQTLRYLPWDGDIWQQPDTTTAAVFTVRGGSATRVRLGMLALPGRNATFRRLK